MKIIVKNGTLEFRNFKLKPDYTWAEITAMNGYLTGHALAKLTGKPVKSPSYEGYAISAFIPLGDAQSISFKGINNQYLGMISFYSGNDNLDADPVMHIEGNDSSLEENRNVVISASDVTTAKSLGAKYFIIVFYIAPADGEIHLTL